VSQQHQTFQLATGWTVKQGDIPSGIGLATMRLDGFVSLDAGPSGGRLLTRPLMFTGEQLEINANVRGQVTVSVMDEDCQPIPGFDHKDCRPILGDSVRHSVSWKAGSDVSSLQSRTVRLEFILTRAELYAFRFVGLFPNGKAR